MGAVSKNFSIALIFLGTLIPLKSIALPILFGRYYNNYNRQNNFVPSPNSFNTNRNAHFQQAQQQQQQHYQDYQQLPQQHLPQYQQPLQPQPWSMGQQQFQVGNNLASSAATGKQHNSGYVQQPLPQPPPYNNQNEQLNYADDEPPFQVEVPMMEPIRRMYHVYEDNVRGFAKRFRNIVYTPLRMMG